MEIFHRKTAMRIMIRGSHRRKLEISIYICFFISHFFLPLHPKSCESDENQGSHRCP